MNVLELLAITLCMLRVVGGALCLSEVPKTPLTYCSFIVKNIVQKWKPKKYFKIETLPGNLVGIGKSQLRPSGRTFSRLAVGGYIRRKNDGEQQVKWETASSNRQQFHPFKKINQKKKKRNALGEVNKHQKAS
ncbi:hypothetical protein QBC45DRAFT_407838 [Copromyces sp. CBS 386.78]|nr:hypothetical protein QBC45DRAFT_407838 [Copromyces sp. CBS 386.78]